MTKTTRVRSVPFLCIVTVLFALTACQPPLPPQSTTGTLQLTFDASSIPDKTIVPPIDMDIASYDVNGSNTTGATFSQTAVVGQNLTVDALQAGSWTIEIDAKNSGGTVIGHGVGYAAITGGATSVVTIVVEPLEGAGTFNLAVTWDAFAIPSLTVTARLTSSGGVDNVLTMTTSSGSAAGGGGFERGYYDLTVSATDGASTTYYYEAVRIVAGQTTSATLEVQSSLQTGGVTITIVNQMQNPIEISFAGVVNPLTAGNDMTVTATTAPAVVDTRQWMLNYQNLPGQTGSSITLGSTLSPGTYALTLRVTLGGIISSKTVLFDVIQAAANSTVIMAYVDGDNNLDPYAVDDVNEMEAVSLAGTGIKIIALVDRLSGDWTNTRLYEINHDPAGYNSTLVSTRLSGMGLTATGNEELNMGSQTTLSDFIDFCKANYPADNYALVLWNHGGGWRNRSLAATLKAVCWDDTNGGDSLYMSEVRGATAGKGLSLIGFDACLMGMIEVAYELRDNARIMVASEETEPGDGWDYVALLTQYKSSDKSMNALANAIVASYGNFYSSASATLAAVDLTQMGGLLSAVNTFAANLQSVSGSTLYTARAGTQQFYCPDNVDLYDFADRISVAGAAEVKSAVSSAVLYNWSHASLRGHGLAVYYPTTGIDSSYATAIQFPGASAWDEFLAYSLSVSALDPDLYEPDDTAAAGQWITDGEEQTHNLHNGTDNDYMKFNAAAGTQYTLETFSPVDNTDTVMYLYGTDGTTQLAYNDDKALQSKIVWSCPADGIYFIKIRGYGGDTGAYSIKLTSAVVTQCTITAGAGANGSISPSGSVPVAQGANQTFYMYPGSGYTVQAVTVDGASQGALASYTFSNVQADHTISVTFQTMAQDSYEPDDVAASAHTIASGEEQSHTLHSSADVDFVKFDALPSTQYTIETFSPGGNTDTILYLYDTDGVTVLTYNDDKAQLKEENSSSGSKTDKSSLKALQSKIVWICDTAGIYYVKVSGYGGDTGSYSIKLTSATPSTMTWGEHSWTDDAAGRWSIDGTDLVMTGIGLGTPAFAFTDDNFTDFAFEVKASKATGTLNNPVGVWFRCIDGNNGYCFNVAPDGEYSLWKMVGGSATAIASWASSSAILPGLNAWNTLKVTAGGSSLSIYVNDTLLGTYTDTSFASGKIGLYTYDHDTTPFAVGRFKDAVFM
ncbi:MAG: DUF1080 domain-containing protein [Spirochaetales bacterium]|nr:DUF1080 domain-containing protein [Spirochaetales bacterium]